MAATLKVKTPAKIQIPSGPLLRKYVLETVQEVAAIVGSTLGPGGHPVLLERQEYGLPPAITKDGVTVMRHLGFADSVKHALLEVLRDAANRTVAEAGDGTTTATVLAAEIVTRVDEFCKNHPETSPQRAMAEMSRIYHDLLAPVLAKVSIKADLSTPEGRSMLRGVGKVSANGDEPLADAVLECFDLCGDAGNVTISEESGSGPPSVEKVEGYPIQIGYEDCCGKVYPVFVNREDLQQVVLDKPLFLLYFGRLNDLNPVAGLLSQVQEYFEAGALPSPNVVLVATTFGEAALKAMAVNWKVGTSINILPLCLPLTAQHNAQRYLVDDLAGWTDAQVYDPVTAPAEGARFGEWHGEVSTAGLGNLTVEGGKFVCRGVERIEMGRYRTTIHGVADEGTLLDRATQVQQQVAQPAAELEAMWNRERLARLTGGVAKLTIRGSSGAELRERRDRAEDAVCAVRSAVKDGCVPGGGWAMALLSENLPDTPVCREILAPALSGVVQRLVGNAGVTTDEMGEMLANAPEGAGSHDPLETCVPDLVQRKFVHAVSEGLLDATPAVRAAIQNGLAMAMLGTLGAIVVYPRDPGLERQEGLDQAEFERVIKVDHGRVE